MPSTAGSIIGTEQDPTHIAILTADGKSHTITQTDLWNYLQNSTAPNKQADGLIWIANTLVASIGEQFLSPTQLEIEFSMDDASFSLISIHRYQA